MSMFFNDDSMLNEESVDLSYENQSLLVEAMLQSTDDIVTEEEIDQLYQQGLLSERNIVKYDKKTKRKRLQGQAAIILAKEKNDPLYKKLQKAQMLRKKYKDAINKKYGSKAVKKAKEMQKHNHILAAKDIAIDKHTKPKDA